MADDRPFVSQETLDIWLAEGRVQVDGDVLQLPASTKRFTLKTAVHFTADLTETGDPHQLLGRVKDVEALAAMGGEHVSDSVILGDTAYLVVEGFLGEPATSGEPGNTIPPPDAPTDDNLARLARFFVGS